MSIVRQILRILSPSERRSGIVLLVLMATLLCTVCRWKRFRVFTNVIT